MPANFKKEKQLQDATLHIWKWLRRLPEYQADHEKWRGECRSGKVLPFEIIKSGARLLDAGREDELFHKYLGNPLDAKQPIKEATESHYKRQEEYRRKWGFYPLANPQSKWGPLSFSEMIKQEFAGGHFNAAVWPLNFYSILTLDPPSGSPPDFLQVKIDFRQGDRIIRHQLEKILVGIRKHYGIKIDQSRSDNADLVLKNIILIRAGFTKKEIQKRLTKERGRSDDSYKATLNKAYNKAKKSLQVGRH